MYIKHQKSQATSYKSHILLSHAFTFKLNIQILSNITYILKIHTSMHIVKYITHCTVHCSLFAFQSVQSTISRVWSYSYSKLKLKLIIITIHIHLFWSRSPGWRREGGGGGWGWDANSYTILLWTDLNYIHRFKLWSC